MSETDAAGYEFLDCGNGRRLERLGGVLVDRPAPAAAASPGLPAAAWKKASLVFERNAGWKGREPDGWRVAFGPAALSLRPASQGQVGVFPEHAAVCDRLDDLRRNQRADKPIRILNLFAHTGLATLRFASWGNAEVAHVDGAAAAVRQARENAALSRLDGAPIRWLTDDAMIFMRRELRRGGAYDLILADPPSYGRGGKRGEWKLERDLPELLDAAARLLRKDGIGVCLTCHSEGWDRKRLAMQMQNAFPNLNVDGSDLLLRSTKGGRTLDTGCVVVATIQQ